MIYVARVPKPPLECFVDAIWVCRKEPGPAALQRVLPTGAAQVIVNLKEDGTRLYRTAPPYSCESRCPGAILSGVQSRAVILDTAEQEWVAGVSFRPGGTVAFFREPAHETRDLAVPLEALWAGGAGLRARLLEAGGAGEILAILESFLAGKFRRREADAVVGFALREFDRGAGVGAVRQRTGLSARHFIEKFKAAVGVPPKRYCRILRFQQALASAERGGCVDWTRVAMDCGYFDQAHFIHDFRSFAGITPTAYEAGRTGFRNHVEFLQG